MAIELKNSMFIHVPKCGGRTVKTLLQKYVSNVKIIGDVTYDSHATPDTNKQVFGFIRHPATFIHSLWTHRGKKKTNTRGHPWNWQTDIRLERECKSTDYNEFVENILKDTNYVWDYYHYYLGKYENVQYGKIEDLTESLIRILKENEEDFDEDGIRSNMIVIGANDKKKPVGLFSSMDPEQIYKLVTVSEKQLCERFNYHAL
jgi:hypothetical protein